MNEFKEIEKIAHSDIVELGASFKELLHKKLCLGMTRHVARFGTLSDGHNKITPSQRYFQAVKEMYYISMSIKEQQCVAMEAQADLLDAQDEITKSYKESERLRAEAKLLKAKTRLVASHTQICDNMRVLDEFNKVRRELEPSVMAQYPEGIEQAEEDNWIAVAEYQAYLKQMGMQQNLTAIPLSPEKKAEIGLANNCPEMAAWDVFANKDLLLEKHNGDVVKYLESKYKKQELTHG